MSDIIDHFDDTSIGNIVYFWLNRLDEETKSFAVTKGAWDFKKGEQLFEPYGQPNHIYFAYHGFLLDHNAHDCVSLNLAVSKNHPKRVEIQKELKMARVRSTSFCVSTSKITTSLLEYMRIAFGGGATRTLQRERLGALCEERLGKYPTTIEEDISLIQKGNVNYKIMTAIKFRLSEKKILREVADAYSSNAAHGEL
jgi:hypothetical protein